MTRTLPFALALAFVGQSALAQTPLTTAVDFTAKDIDGNTFNLFAKLAEGKHVVLDFMFTNCGPCQATAPNLIGAFQNYGCNTDGAEIFFVSINRDDNNAVMHSWETTYFGGTGPFPLGISGTEGSATGGAQSIDNDYGISAYPTMILIAPDHSIIEQDMWPITDPGTFTTYFQSHGLDPMSCSVGITEAVEAPNVTLAPVPAGNELNVSIANGTVGSIRITDISGRVVIAANAVQAAHETVDVSALRSGVYYTEVIGTDGQSTKLKFVKQ